MGATRRMKEMNVRRIVSCMVVAVALGAMVFTGLDAQADPSKFNFGQCIADAEALRKASFQKCLASGHQQNNKNTAARCASDANWHAQKAKASCRKLRDIMTHGSMMMQEEEKNK